MADMSPESLIHKWLELVNADEFLETRITNLFAPDAQVIFFSAGKSKDFVTFKGHADLIEWFRHLPEGRFIFEGANIKACEPHPDLPLGEVAASVRYTIIHPESEPEFRNAGDLVVHGIEGRISAMLQAPDDV